VAARINYHLPSAAFFLVWYAKVLTAGADPVETIPVFSPDDVVSERFRIIRFIGRGGMGEVYEARDTRRLRDVAIKVLPQSFANDANRLRSRFTVALPTPSSRRFC